MDILAGNRLIAEFMGATTCKHGIFEAVNFPDATNEGFKSYDLIYLKYHSSWDWLMPVVEKIESVMYGVSNSAELWYDDEEGVVDRSRIQYVCIISDKYSRIIVNSANYFPEKDSKLTATWYAVVEFIKLHNK